MKAAGTILFLLISSATFAQAPRKDIAPPSTHEGLSTARNYYQELWSAGAFSLWGSKSKVLPPTEDYVCFSDAPHSSLFFTFVARGYDQDWADVYSKWFKLAIDDSSDFQEVEKYYHQMQAIEEAADYPYLRFIRPEELSDFSSAVQHGTRFLTAHVYEKGVKIATIEFVGSEGQWQDSVPGTKALSHLMIEPTTMRYVWDMKTGTAAGVCEKVKDRSEIK